MPPSPSSRPAHCRWCKAEDLAQGNRWRHGHDLEPRCKRSAERSRFGLCRRRHPQRGHRWLPGRIPGTNPWRPVQRSVYVGFPLEFGHAMLRRHASQRLDEGRVRTVASSCRSAHACPEARLKSAFEPFEQLNSHVESKFEHHQGEQRQGLAWLRQRKAFDVGLHGDSRNPRAHHAECPYACTIHVVHDGLVSAQAFKSRDPTGAATAT